MTVSLFSPDESAVLLIDHQVGTMSWVKSIDVDVLKRNARALAKTAIALNMPLVLTSSLEDQAQGPMMPEMKDIAPKEYAGRIQRQGVVNAMDDPNFAAAVKATGRRSLIIAGVTNDVCTVYPTLTALDQGFQVRVVADAGGSTTALGDQVALRRMELAGAGLNSTDMIIAELVRNWTSPNGMKVVPIVGELTAS